MSVTYYTIPSKLAKMQDDLCENGMDRDSASIHVGECMEEEDRLFTEGDLCSAMNDVYNEAIKALKNHPEALKSLQLHFNS